jgi:hypothetical protein
MEGVISGKAVDEKRLVEKVSRFLRFLTGYARHDPHWTSPHIVFGLSVPALDLIGWTSLNGTAS